jgi:cell cycle related kinase
MGEMINNSPLFPGENDIDQLAVVLQALGTPTLESWPVGLSCDIVIS